MKGQKEEDQDMGRQRKMKNNARKRGRENADPNDHEEVSILHGLEKRGKTELVDNKA